MEYLLNVAGLERHLPICKVSDDIYIAAFIMFNDVEVTVACAEELLKRHLSLMSSSPRNPREFRWHTRWQGRPAINRTL